MSVLLNPTGLKKKTMPTYICMNLSYIYIYIYIYNMVVSVTLCFMHFAFVRRMQNAYIYCHLLTDSFVVPQLFSMARHVGRLKLG